MKKNVQSKKRINKINIILINIRYCEITKFLIISSAPCNQRVFNKEFAHEHEHVKKGRPL